MNRQAKTEGFHGSLCAKAEGFSLAELLLVLLILGNIATFTIPKVLSSQNDARRTAVFRETIAAYNQALYLGVLTGEFTAGNCDTCAANEYPFNKYFETKINYVKQCSQSVSGGCYVGTCFEPNAPGQILASGASTCGVTLKTTNEYDNFYIDWDGPNHGPGIEGDDQIRVRACIRDGCPNGQRPGTILPRPGSPDSEDLFQKIFSR